MWNVWLLLLGNISSRLSTIIDYFEIPIFVIDEQTQIEVNPLSFQCHLYQDDLDLPQLKQLFPKCCCLQWNRDNFLENRTRKIKLLSKCSLFNYILYLFLWLCRKSCNKSKSNKMIGTPKLIVSWLDGEETIEFQFQPIISASSS